MKLNLVDTIRHETEPYQGRAAFVEGQRSITYAELFRNVKYFANALKQMGVRRLHRVGLLCNDGIDYVIASLAALSLYAVIVPISPKQTQKEIQTAIERIDLDFIIVETDLFSGDGQKPILGDGVVTTAFALVRRTTVVDPPADYASINPAFIRFSSGTTGVSKGVLLSHETIIARTDAANRALEISARDTVLWTLSMSYHFVVSILLFLRRGATTVLCANSLPDALIDGLTRLEGTFVYAAPAHYDLLSRCEQLSENAMKKIRLAISASEKLPLHVAERFVRRFGVELSEAYGIIEVGLPCVRLSGGLSAMGSVGKALPDYKIRLDGQDIDGVGEIFIRGKGMLDAYCSPWQDRKKILKDGWFRTGDLGRMDGDGFLHIVGRNEDVINLAEVKIFAQEIEAVINSHPAVAESLVYGEPHPDQDHVKLLVSKVVLRDSRSDDDDELDELRRFCLRSLESHQIPQKIIVVDSLPKTISGKLKRGVFGNDYDSKTDSTPV